uniref:AH domain-containing protein n=1 Tax=Fundulus heteroclitus TaxID=8078 RepID=A0A3Q2TGY2_FUNHE
MHLTDHRKQKYSQTSDFRDGCASKILLAVPQICLTCFSLLSTVMVRCNTLLVFVPPPPEVTATPQRPDGGPVIIQASSKNPASEKLERVRKWSVSKYKCTRQALAERLGRGSRTVDLDLEPRLELLRDDRQRYDHMTKLAQTLAGQFAQFSVTQKTLGDAFTELSFKSRDLHVEFGMNAEAQKFLSKSTEDLTSAISSFTCDMNTLVNKTIEDTMINAKQYEAARWGQPFSTSLQGHAGKRVTDPRLPLCLQVKVLHNQLWLLHNAVAAHCLSCHGFLEKNMQQALEHLSVSSVAPPSWLEES